MSRFQQAPVQRTTRRRCSWLTAIGCLACGLSNARAATITETVPFTIQAPAAANLATSALYVSTPQLNSALGTFESGTTAITGTVHVALEFFNTGAGSAYDVLLTDTLSLGGIPGFFVKELTGSLPPDQPAYITTAQTFAFGPVDRSVPGSIVVGPGAWTQLFTLPFPSLTVNHGPQMILPALVITGSSVTTYTYAPTATAVPEPPLFFTLAPSLALGLLVRNRHIRYPATSWPLKQLRRTNAQA